VFGPASPRRLTATGSRAPSGWHGGRRSRRCPALACGRLGHEPVSPRLGGQPQGDHGGRRPVGLGRGRAASGPMAEARASRANVRLTRGARLEGFRSSSPQLTREGATAVAGVSPGRRRGGGGRRVRNGTPRSAARKRSARTKEARTCEPPGLGPGTVGRGQRPSAAGSATMTFSMI
jgi:hypothetical protein